MANLGLITIISYVPIFAMSNPRLFAVHYPFLTTVTYDDQSRIVRYPFLSTVTCDGLFMLVHYLLISTVACDGQFRLVYYLDLADFALIANLG